MSFGGRGDGSLSLDTRTIDHTWNDGHMTGLQYAACNGRNGIVDALLTMGVDVNPQPAYDGGGTALQATSEGHLPIVDRLLEKGQHMGTEDRPCRQQQRVAILQLWNGY